MIVARLISVKREAARQTSARRDVTAGCFDCSGSDTRWLGGQAQGTAARHHDATGHATWCDIAMSVRYGSKTPDPRQLDIEDSIAVSPEHQPEMVPLPELDKAATAPILNKRGSQ